MLGALSHLKKKKLKNASYLKKNLKNALHTGTLNYWTRLYFNELYFCVEGIIIEHWRTSQDSLVRQNDLPPVFSNRFFSAPLLLAIMKIIGKDLWTAKIINQKVNLLLSATRQRTRVKWFWEALVRVPLLATFISTNIAITSTHLLSGERFPLCQLHLKFHNTPSFLLVRRLIYCRHISQVAIY